MGDEIDVIQSIDTKANPDTIDIIEFKATRTLRSKALKELEKEQAKSLGEGKPFCFRCAKLDYEKEQEDLFLRPGAKKKYSIARNVPITQNTKAYGLEKRFKFLRETVKKETQRINGARITYVTTYKDYQCQTRGCRISLESKTELQKE